MAGDKQSGSPSKGKSKKRTASVGAERGRHDEERELESFESTRAEYTGYAYNEAQGEEPEASNRRPSRPKIDTNLTQASTRAWVEASSSKQKTKSKRKSPRTPTSPRKRVFSDPSVHSSAVAVAYGGEDEHESNGGHEEGGDGRKERNRAAVAHQPGSEGRRQSGGGRGQRHHSGEAQQADGDSDCSLCGIQCRCS